MKKAKKHTKKHSKKGFSLIELLIVVAIILIIAAIAIPNLLRSRIAANEASAVGSLRTLNTSMITYNVTYPDQGFAVSMAELGPATSGTPSSAAAGLIDQNLVNGTKSGYTFALHDTSSTLPNQQYEFAATPVTANVTGQRGFCTDPSGVIEQFAGASGGPTVPTTVANCQAANSPI
ncbi:MAG TPA: prepilin-type N-terminal cleavage/methylation domain-containing protein [Terriglobales bacterium]|nr:prepilin-type N-terminal cleavage/methylation domain-containing protein [Terriglobales bacterium]